MSNEDIERLTYRELADRLGIKPHAARMRVSRQAAKGRWRIVPGNHPGAAVLVEIPASDLSRDMHVRGSTVPPAREGHHVGAQGEVLVLVEALAASQAQIADLTDRLLSETRARMQDREALAASEAMARMLEAEIERLNMDRTQMVDMMQKARKPWWRR